MYRRLATLFPLASLMACVQAAAPTPHRTDGASPGPDATAPADAGGVMDARRSGADASSSSPTTDASTPPPDATVDDATIADPDAGGGSTGSAHQLIADRHFQRGFTVLNPTSGMADGRLSRSGVGATAPAWQLGQWGRSASLNTAPAETLPSGAVRWGDRFGSVTLAPLGAPEADVVLHVDAFEEYGGVYRPPADPRTWPHLLAEQRISPPGAEGPGCPPLTELASLEFSVETRLLFDRRHLGPGHDPNRHAAQFLVYFTVQNLSDPSAPGYGDYLWLGMTLYDDRDARPALYVNGDAGTGKLIYNLGLRPLTDATLSDGEWHAMNVDLLPHALQALRTAWERGFLPDSHDPGDYRIGGMNIGWEVPGLNDASMQVRGLSLTYTRRGGMPSGGGGGTASPLRFDFDTDGDREGWRPLGMEDRNGGPRGGRWILWVPGDDPMLLSPPLAMDASRLRTLTLSFANDGNPASTSRMQVFWKRRGDAGFDEARSLWLTVPNDGGWRTSTLDLGTHSQWNGTIEQVRIDPVIRGDGHAVGFDWIEFSP